MLGAIALVAVDAARAPRSAKCPTARFSRSTRSRRCAADCWSDLYSRFGWHHPGPLYFYLLAPWYWLSGSTAGMQAGALVINLWRDVADRPDDDRRRRRRRRQLPCRPSPRGMRFEPATCSSAPGILTSSCCRSSPTSFLRRRWRAVRVARIFWVSWPSVRSSRRHTWPWSRSWPFLASRPRGTAAVCRTPPGHRRGLKLVLWIPPLVEQLTHRPGNLVSIVDSS